MNGYFACVPQTSGTGCSDSSRRLLRYQLCSTSLIAANCALWKIIDISVNNRIHQRIQLNRSTKDTLSAL